MKEFDFSTLQNLPVPESWLENALAIPETEAQKPAAVPFWRKPRFIAMAAALVLVSALSIALSLTMGKSPVVVKPDGKPSATEIVWSTDEHGATVATEVVVVPADDDRQDSTSPTEPKSAVVRIIERLFGTDSNPSPTTANGSGRDRINSDAKTDPTEKGRTNPTERSGTTTKPGSTEGGKPSVTPTEVSYDPEPIDDPPAPTAKTSPTEPPTEEPTEGEWEPPTATPWVNPTEPGWDDPPPIDPKPTESRYKATVNISVSGFAVTRISQDGNVVYCRIYDDDGNSYGDSERYSDQHLAQMKSASVGRTLSYSPRDYGILPEDGCYRYEFYTPSGRIIASGSAYLSAT